MGGSARGRALLAALVAFVALGTGTASAGQVGVNGTDFFFTPVLGEVPELTDVHVLASYDRITVGDATNLIVKDPFETHCRTQGFNALCSVEVIGHASKLVDRLQGSPACQYCDPPFFTAQVNLGPLGGSAVLQGTVEGSLIVVGGAGTDHITIGPHYLGSIGRVFAAAARDTVDVRNDSYDIVNCDSAGVAVLADASDTLDNCSS